MKISSNCIKNSTRLASLFSALLFLFPGVKADNGQVDGGRNMKTVLQKGDSLQGVDLEPRGIFWLNQIAMFSAERFVNGRELSFQQKQSIAFALQNGDSEMTGFQSRVKKHSPLAGAVLKKAKECAALRGRNQEFNEDDCLNQLMASMQAYGAQVVKAKYFLAYMQNIGSRYDRERQHYSFMSNGFQGFNTCRPNDLVCFNETELGNKFLSDMHKVCIQSAGRAYDVSFNFPEPLIRAIGNNSFPVDSYALYEVTGPFKKLAPAEKCSSTGSVTVLDGQMKYKSVVYVEPGNTSTVAFVPADPTIKVSK